MAGIDFSKGLDFTPLEKMGITRRDSLAFLTALSPFVDMELQVRIKKAFTEEEFLAIGDEAIKKGTKPEEGMFFLEKKFHEKTGNYFMEEMRLLLNEYIVHAANILKTAKEDTEKFSDSGGQNVKHFNELIEEKKWDEASKFLDEILKKGKTT